MSFSATDPSNHQSENTWFTPRSVVEKLGVFDLDPCTVSFRPFDIAIEHIERDLGECGLSINWKNKRCFINPPYGKEITPFIEKFIEEKPSGFMLIFSRMGSEGVQKLIKNGAYVFCLRKRITFIQKQGIKKTNAGTDSCLVFWNKDEIRFLSEIDGILITLTESRRDG